MVDTTTTVLGLVKQTIGGNRNTWGAILNSCMDLIEGAFYGMTSKVVTGAGDVTLTDAERRKRIIVFTGTLSANQIIIVANLVGRWTVRNATSGNFTLSFKTASGTAVTIPQDGYSDVWGDGADNMFAGLSSRLRDTQMAFPDGTEAAPGASFGSETNLGLRRAGYASGTLTNPFSTTNLDATVTVAHTAHALAVNDPAFFSGASAVGGITLDGLYPVASVVDADHYTIEHSSAATSTVSGGGGTPSYKYLKSAVSGGAEALVANGNDVVHVSPFGIAIFGKLYATGDAILAGALSVAGALSAATATFTGLLTGAAATFSGLLTLSSTSHMSMAGGTTAQRPGTPAQKDFRVNTDTGQLEYYWNSAWNVVDLNKSPKGYKFGFTLSNNSSASTTDIDIGVGSCRSSDDGATIILAAALRKSLSSTFVAGNNQGMRSSASLANGTWHIFAIAKDDGTSDIFAHTALNPTSVLPSGYTDYRRIGSILRESGNIIGFTQKGNEFRRKTGAQDINDIPGATTAGLRSLSVPTGIKVGAMLSFSLYNTAGPIGLNCFAVISSPDDTDNAASLANFTNYLSGVSDSGNDAHSEADTIMATIRTDMSGQVRTRLSSANTNFIINGVTYGWLDYLED